MCVTIFEKAYGNYAGSVFLRANLCVLCEMNTGNKKATVLPAAFL